MPRNNRVHFRLSNQEYEQIVMNAKAKGFNTISEYIRALALEKDKFTENIIIETNRLVKEILTKIN